MATGPRRLSSDDAPERIFVAGATGAIGRHLVPMLRDAGYIVCGATRSEEKAARLREARVEAVVVDVFDAQHRSAVLGARSLRGVLLRYGQLYGPGTGVEVPTGSAPLHVEQAALATLCALRSTATGIFNVTESTGYAALDRARTLLGWTPTAQA